MRVLIGVVYMMNNKGPRTEASGTPQEDVYQEDTLLDLGQLSLASFRGRLSEYQLRLG